MGGLSTIAMVHGYGSPEKENIENQAKSAESSLEAESSVPSTKSSQSGQVRSDSTF